MDDAIAAFEGVPEFWCDRQFAVLPKVVLCFLTMDETKDQSHVQSPSSVTWKPRRLDYEPLNEENADTKLTWLPYDVREVFDRSGSTIVRRRRHHVFLRPQGDLEFIYAGKAHLVYMGVGSYGFEESPRNSEAHFSLDEKLSREIWLRCGGYSGWNINVNHEERVVPHHAFDEFDEMLAQLFKKDHSHLCMTRFEEDSLSIYTNSTRAWLMYLRNPADGGLYVNAPILGDNEEHFDCSCGISLEFPRSQTVSHSEAVTIARHYFAEGTLPGDIDWKQ